LIDFALSCRLPELSQFLLPSSIAAVSRLENLPPILKHAVPATVAAGSGYRESKWVEVLLIEAISRTPLHVVVVRSGQVSRRLDGYWNSSDWFPSIIQSASSVKCLPLTSTKMVSTCRSCGTVPPNVSHVATHFHHPADGIFYTLGCFCQGNRRPARFPQPKFSISLTHCHTMELRHLTDSRHTLCPVDLLPWLSLPPRTRRRRRRFERISQCLTAPRFLSKGEFRRVVGESGRVVGYYSVVEVGRVEVLEYALSFLLL